ncbi:MAG: universal stress protein family protein [Candidatus Scalindua rubra]|uniref:Universal stress protein family protein n=1 Tax=Candidatus Scalindua rubra TaxID=1872076 RepID=A0A1E3X780_9BACT|nr:MAG: universal stress protein family protein [Candidatus Scalindua rubra]
MLKTILVPIDSSDTSLVAVDYAIELSKSFNSEIIGISIIDIKKFAGPFMRDLGTSIGGMVPYADFQQKVRKFLEDTSRAALDELEGKCNSANIPCTRTIKEGVVSKEIVESAQKCDMISMGMAGEHAMWRDALLGSNLESVARQTHKPIMVTPEKYKTITKILVAYDGSPFSTKALNTGAEIAQQMHLPLTVITVSDNKDTGEKILSKAEENLKNYEITHNTILESGETVDIVLSLCKNGSYELLVMGAYGHSKIRELILGSTTVQLMRKVNCPVLLYR